MSAQVTYLISAVVESDEGTRAVTLPVRRVSRPSWEVARRLIRREYPGAIRVTVRRQVKPQAA